MLQLRSISRSRWQSQSRSLLLIRINNVSHRPGIKATTAVLEFVPPTELPDLLKELYGKIICAIYHDAAVGPSV